MILLEVKDFLSALLFMSKSLSLCVNLNISTWHIHDIYIYTIIHIQYMTYTWQLCYSHLWGIGGSHEGAVIAVDVAKARGQRYGRLCQPIN